MGTKSRNLGKKKKILEQNPGTQISKIQEKNLKTKLQKSRN
jgi:hypothetical protein